MIVILLLALAWPPSWWRETNSHAASARGASAYAKQQYSAAVTAFQRAQALARSPQSAFNLGTAQIAAGQREQGSATLEQAIKDPALRADALYNRGNSAMAAKAYDHAIRDYIDALRARPDHAAAKRNLEIAMQRRETQRKEQDAGGQNKQPQQQQQQKPSPSNAQKPKPGQMDVEALLRSVQQQEQEELRRMKGHASEERVGW